jgi:hypothetical protein
MILNKQSIAQLKLQLIYILIQSKKDPPLPAGLSILLKILGIIMKTIYKLQQG